MVCAFVRGVCVYVCVCVRVCACVRVCMRACVSLSLSQQFLILMTRTSLYLPGFCSLSVTTTSPLPPPPPRPPPLHDLPTPPPPPPPHPLTIAMNELAYQQMSESRFRLTQALKLTVRFDVIENREQKVKGEAFGLTKVPKWHELSYIIPTVYIAARFGSLVRSLASRSISQ